MAKGPETLLQYVRRLVIASPGDSDAALLGRFISARDERAFTALVDRHGALVLHVCQRILGDVHDAEDAFQAVFLVLARKAAAVQPREALAAWLHGVARRVALKALAARARQVREAQSPTARPADPRPDPLSELSGRELVKIIDEELQRLPKAYRLPTILCCLQGRSLEEAARQLGWTRGSVKGRLERGRARLHERLLRRDLTLPAVLAAAEVSRAAAPTATVGGLIARTVRSAVAFGVHQTAGVEGVSAEATVLAGEILRGMALAKLKIAAALMLATCLLASGFVIYTGAPSPSTTAAHVRSSPSPPKGDVAWAARPAAVNRRTTEPRDEDSTPMEVSGRVLDPTGKPLPGANLYMGYSVHRFAPDIEPDVQSRQTAYSPRAKSGADGQFQFTFATSELDARALDDWRPAVIAVASGYGPDWAEVGESDRGRQLSLKLVEDFPVTGRILDPKNKPVVGAKVLVHNAISDPKEGVSRYLRGQINAWYPRIWRGPFPEQPPRITTDADGRFLLTGQGRDRIVTFALEGSTIPDTSLTVITRPANTIPAGFRGATFDYVARPSRFVSGVVRDKTTSRPLMGVKVTVQQASTLTDNDGRFEIFGCTKADGYTVRAQPQTGQPYFAASVCVKEKAGADPLVVDIGLASGILVSGRVTDASRQKPPRAALVEYYPLFPNSHCNNITNWSNLASSSAVIGLDGTYSLVVLPGPGVVCVAASPRNSYAVAMVDDKELANHLHPGRNHGGAQALCTDLGADVQGCLDVDKYNALSPIKPDEAAERLALDFTLQSARMAQGSVVAPDGQPLSGVRVIGLTSAPDDEMLESASFTVMGLNPQRHRNLFFHHQGKNLGKRLTITGDETEPLTVRLDPCGSVIGRMVDKRGQPVQGVPVYFKPWDDMARSDSDGRFHMALVPDQKYSLFMFRHLLRDVGEFAVESDRSNDLGDLLLGD